MAYVVNTGVLKSTNIKTFKCDAQWFTGEIMIVEQKKIDILCFFEFKTITTCDIENLTAQIHGLYNCHQVIKNMVCHVTVTFYHSFSVTPVLSTEFSYLSSLRDSGSG